MLKRICDRCGKEISRDEDYIKMQVTPITNKVLLEDLVDNYDLCKECESKFNVFMSRKLALCLGDKKECSGYKDGYCKSIVNCMHKEEEC